MDVSRCRSLAALYWRVAWTPRIGIVAFIVFTAASVSDATGQSVMAVGASLVVQSNPKVDCQFACGLPRSAYGGSLSFGNWLTPRVAIAAEATVGAVLRGRQQIRMPGTHIESETTHEDMIFVGTAQWSLRPVGTGLNGILVGGLGVALRQTDRTGPFRFVDGMAGAGRPGNASDLVPSIVGGFDLPLRVYRYVWFVPSARLHYLFDQDGSRDYPRRGVDNVLVNIGAKVAVQF